MPDQVTITNGRIDGYITVKEYAKKYGVTTAAVYMAIGRGRLVPTMIEGRRFFKDDEPYFEHSKPGRKREE